MSRNRILTALLFLAILVSTSAAAQHRMRMPQSEAKIDLPAGVEEISLPFDVVNNHMILSVSVNGSEPFRAVLDTGMPMGGLVLYGTERVKALDLPVDPGMQVAIGGAGGDGGHQMAEMSLGNTLTLGDLKISEERIVVTPPIPHFTGYHEGIIGAVLFRNFVVRIDHEKNIITLRKPESFQPPENAVAIPLTFRMGFAFVNATVVTADGTKVPVELAVDTGARHPVSLNTDSTDLLAIPGGAVETEIGRGISGPVLGHVGRVRSLDLGGLVLTDVIATFPGSDHQSPGGMDSRNGNLGNGVMRRFQVTFDYAGKRMLLEPTDRMDRPFEWDMSGIVWSQDEKRGMWIESLVAGSPAEKAGLQVDDVLVGMDGRSASDLTFIEVREMLRRKGERVTLRVRRGADEVEAQVTLRPLV